MPVLVDANKCPGSQSISVIEIEGLSSFHPKLVLYVTMPTENEIILPPGNLRNSLAKLLSNGLFVETF